MAVPLPIAIPHDVVFPHGLYATGEVEEVLDFDKPGRPPKVDPETGLRAYAFPALDADPAARGASKAVKITIYAKVQPVLPAPTGGLPFALVELEGLTVRPYVSEGSKNMPARLAFSYRATGVKAVKGAGSKPASGGQSAA